MKKLHIPVILLSTFGFIFFACGAPKKTPAPEQPVAPSYEKLQTCSWIMGTWENASEEGNMMERWSAMNDSVFKGESYFIAGKDTLHAEQITIEQRGQDVFYIPVIKTQNNGQPTLFKLTSGSDKKMVFENPEHDFPQMISYELKGDSLIAEISGNTPEGPVKERFPMKRAEQKL